MSTIVGTYTNTALKAKLVITTVDNKNGAIQGTFSQAGSSWEISGNWNTSAISPNAVFYFGGSVLKPATVFVAGAGAATTTAFDDTTISISIAQKGGVVSSLEGRFVRSN